MIKEKRQGNAAIINRLSVLAMISFLLWGSVCFSQERHVFNQKDYEKFKMARQLCYKGEQLFKKGKYKKAEKAFRECLDKFPTYADADFYMSRIYYDTGDYQNARVHIERARKNHKFVSDLNVSFYLEYLENLRKQKDDLEESLRNVKASMAAAPGPSGSTSSGSKQKSEAERTVSRLESSIHFIKSKLSAPVPEKIEMPADYYYVHGNIHFKCKRYKESLDQYLLAVKADPGHGNAYNNLANLYYMAKRYKQALHYLEKAESLGVEINEKFKAAILTALEK